MTNKPSCRNPPRRLASLEHRPASFAASAASSPQPPSILRNTSVTSSHRLSRCHAAAASPHLGSAARSSSNLSCLAPLRRPLTGVQIDEMRIGKLVAIIEENYLSDPRGTADNLQELKNLILNCAPYNYKSAIQAVQSLAEKGCVGAVDLLSDVAHAKSEMLCCASNALQQIAGTHFENFQINRYAITALKQLALRSSPDHENSRIHCLIDLLYGNHADVREASLNAIQEVCLATENKQQVYQSVFKKLGMRKPPNLAEVLDLLKNLVQLETDFNSRKELIVFLASFLVHSLYKENITTKAAVILKDLAEGEDRLVGEHDADQSNSICKLVVDALRTKACNHSEIARAILEKLAIGPKKKCRDAVFRRMAATACNRFFSKHDLDFALAILQHVVESETTPAIFREVIVVLEKIVNKNVPYCAERALEILQQSVLLSAAKAIETQASLTYFAWNALPRYALSFQTIRKAAFDGHDGAWKALQFLVENLPNPVQARWLIDECKNAICELNSQLNPVAGAQPPPNKPQLEHNVDEMLSLLDRIYQCEESQQHAYLCRVYTDLLGARCYAVIPRLKSLLKGEVHYQEVVTELAARIPLLKTIALSSSGDLVLGVINLLFHLAKHVDIPAYAELIHTFQRLADNKDTAIQTYALDSLQLLEQFYREHNSKKSSEVAAEYSSITIKALLKATSTVMHWFTGESDLVNEDKPTLLRILTDALSYLISYSGPWTRQTGLRYLQDLALNPDPEINQILFLCGKPLLKKKDPMLASDVMIAIWELAQTQLVRQENERTHAGEDILFTTQIEVPQSVRDAAIKILNERLPSIGEFAFNAKHETRQVALMILKFLATVQENQGALARYQAMHFMRDIVLSEQTSFDAKMEAIETLLGCWIEGTVVIITPLEESFDAIRRMAEHTIQEANQALQKVQSTPLQGPAQVGKKVEPVESFTTNPIVNATHVLPRLIACMGLIRIRGNPTALLARQAAEEWGGFVNRYTEFLSSS